jgi:hypothetical protein
MFYLRASVVICGCSLPLRCFVISSKEKHDGRHEGI